MAIQVWTFFEAVLLGAALGAAYDVFRILRLSFPNGRVLIFLEDILYFALAAVVSFSFIVLQNDGVLRAFLLLGELLGAILYFFTLGLLVMKIAHLIIRFIHSVLLFLYNVLLKLAVKPVVRLCRWIGRKIRGIFRFFRSKYAVVACRLTVRGRGRREKQKSGDKIPSHSHKKHLKQAGKIVYNDDMQNSGGTEPDGKGRKRIWQRKRQGSR